MPWTFAHPAAVLVLRGRRGRSLSLAGLVAGSIAPDLGYYLHRLDLAAVAHTPLGLVTCCLPVGLVLVIVFRLMHRPLALLMPAPHREALLSLPRAPTLTSPGAALRVSLSIALGALSHILWDAFTHRFGYAVVAWPVLQEPVIDLIGEEFHVFTILQHVSTVVGIAVIAVAYRRWLLGVAARSCGATFRDDAWRYLLIALIGTASSAAAALLAWRAAIAEVPPCKIVFRFVIDATDLCVVLLLAVAFLRAWLCRDSEASCES